MNGKLRSSSHSGKNNHVDLALQTAGCVLFIVLVGVDDVFGQSAKVTGLIILIGRSTRSCCGVD